MHLKATEKQTLNAILEYLAAARIFHYRNNTGAMVTNRNTFYRFGAVGSPDVICVMDGQFIGIEVKRVGMKQSPNQRQFQQSLEKAGGRYILAYSVDDIIQQLIKH